MHSELPSPSPSSKRAPSPTALGIVQSVITPEAQTTSVASRGAMRDAADVGGSDAVGRIRAQRMLARMGDGAGGDHPAGAHVTPGISLPPSPNVDDVAYCEHGGSDGLAVATRDVTWQVRVGVELPAP